ncbi:hypothetical protein SALBM135S_08298 [Streptomyces alboniger]
MQGDPEVLEFLNEQLTAELTAINQYFLHAKMQENFGWTKLAKYTRSESFDEMKHAEVLTDRILFLDGLPNYQRLFHVRVGQTVTEMFQADRQVEVEAIDRLRRGIGARLGVLPRDAADLHDGHGRRVREDGAHLEQGLQLVADVVGRHGVEGLGAVAALEQERLSLGDGGQSGAQLVALAREDERRIRLEVRDHIAQSLGIGVLGLLRRGQVSPGVATGCGGLSRYGHPVNITWCGAPSLHPLTK